jgi:hypothetical protein
VNKIYKKVYTKELTSTVQKLNLDFRDRSRVASSLSAAEVLLMLFRAVKSSIGGTALLCSGAVYCSLVCDRQPWYRRAIFTPNDLAAQSRPCSSPAHGQGVMVARVRPRRQPHALESIDEHEYCGYARKSEHFLCRSCVSAQRTALGSRWTHKQLGGAAQRLHI